MPHSTKWTFAGPRHAVLNGAGRRIELFYEDAGFRSCWAVAVDGLVEARCPDLMTAQGTALDLARRLDPARRAA